MKYSEHFNLQQKTKVNDADKSSPIFHGIARLRINLLRDPSKHVDKNIQRDTKKPADDNKPAPKIVVARNTCKPDVIVSLTTWKGRIFHKNFPFNLYSLLTQKTKYKYKVVLVLSEEEFGKDFQLPEIVYKYTKSIPHFEVLWTYRNTKARKNYNPTNAKYPNTPIIVLGDDTIYRDNLVETVYGDYLKSDRKSCLAANVSPFPSGLKVPWRIRLFPPKCMKWIDEDYFVEYFHDNNDLFYGVRLLLNKTKVIRQNWNDLWYKNSAFAQELALTDYHKYNDDEVFMKFISEHPEYS